MPHSIFFSGGYAIHGTSATGALGRPASHGCVRVSPGNAATLYKLVQEEGAQISITGSSPARYAAHKPHRTNVASLHRSHHSHALAYAPGHRYRSVTSVKSWQSAPMTSPFGN